MKAKTPICWGYPCIGSWRVSPRTVESTRETISRPKLAHSYTLTHFSCPTANVALSNTPTHFPSPATNVAHLSSSTSVSSPLTKLAISCTSAHFANVWGFWMSHREPKVTTFYASTSCFLMLAMMLTLMLDHCKRSITSVGLLFTLPPVIKLNGASNGNLNPISGGSAGGNGRQKPVFH